jgi:DNA-binding transcriptional regulator PaaX
MARLFNSHTLKIIKTVSQSPDIPAKDLFPLFSRSQGYKAFYNTIYRLVEQGFLQRKDTLQGIRLQVTDEGTKLINRSQPQKDGVWKLVIFDIPEKQKYVRVILRAKLKALHFKKWQNSIWVSPYALDNEIEEDLNELGKKFFVRLIKTTQINHTEDLEKLFE